MADALTYLGFAIVALLGLLLACVLLTLIAHAAGYLAAEVRDLVDAVRRGH